MRASIIIPAYNAASTIDLCLEAVLGQTAPASSSEIIVVDDGSTDDTRARASAFSSVRLLHIPHAGAAAARNRGAKGATGEFLLFTDADCQPAPDWIERMLAPFSDSSCAVAGAKGVYRTRQKEPVARFVQLEYEEKYAKMSREETIDFIDTYSAAYRRDVFLANRGFDESFPAASVEDQEFSFRLAKQGLILKFAPGAVVYHHHVTSALAYAKRKFRIGCWKVHLHRRHPDKVWRDSHTPFTLKLQVGLLPVLAAELVLFPFIPLARWRFLASALAFCLTALPLARLVIERDRSLAPIVPALLLLRAAALAAGLAAGVAGELGRTVAATRRRAA
ncbi:MAG: glycosyltransferase [Rudaea sp.]